MTMTEAARPPLYVLVGPLGAGKTTLLMRLLAFWNGIGKRVGVLMNEAGMVSLDGAYAGALSAAVRNITGGCVCCDARDGIGEGLAELRRRAEQALQAETAGSALELVIVRPPLATDPAARYSATPPAYLSIAALLLIP